MRIGILSDIHGNEFALEAVLEVARKSRVDRLFILGDLVGYYYNPTKVMAMLSAWDCTWIRGNHEDILFELTTGARNMEDVTKKYGSGHRLALEQLNADSLSLLFNLPAIKEAAVDGVSFLLTHGSPWDHNMYLYPDTEKDIFARFDSYDFDFIFIGHSHYPFSIKTRKAVVVNPGSVGQSRKSGGKASWVLLDTANSSFQFMETVYDTGPLKQLAEKYDTKQSYNYKILERK